MATSFDKKTNILFPFVGDSVGGSHKSALTLIKFLKSSPEFRTFIVLHKKGLLSNLLEDEGIPYSTIKSYSLAGERPNFFYNLLSIVINFRLITKFLHSNNIDIVHGQDLRINLTWSIATKMNKKKYIWHQRQQLSKSLYWRMIKYFADHFVTISSNVHKTMPENIDEINKTLINNPFDLSHKYAVEDSRKWIKENYSLADFQEIFGYVGRIIDWKNIDKLVIHFSKYLNLSKRKAILLIIGTGRKENIIKLRTLIDSVGLSNRVLLCGFSKEPSKIICGLDLLVSASDNEPFGRTIIEAMLQRTVVLVAKGGGHSEIVKDGVNGYLFDVDTTNGFAKKALHVLQSPQTKVLNTAEIFAKNNFSVENHANLITKIYKSV